MEVEDWLVSESQSREGREPRGGTREVAAAFGALDIET
jgi:hypothetical protein